MFSAGFVVCILRNGKPCQEGMQGLVQLLFGTEYAIRLRNKNKRPAVATVWIDGENVSGNGYIVAAGGYCDVERYYDSRTKFQFVSASSEAAIHEGKNNAPDDRNGIIEVRWRIEKEPTPTRVGVTVPSPVLHWFAPTSTMASLCAGKGATLKSMSSGPSPDDFSDEGCTVQGSYSSQRFTTGNIGELESDEVVIRLILKGRRPSLIAKDYKKLRAIVDEFVHPSVGAADQMKLPANFCGECGHNRALDAKPTKFCVCCGTKF